MPRPSRTSAPKRVLRHLARLCGIAPAFYDEKGNVVHAPDDSLRRLVNALENMKLPARPSSARLQRAVDILRARRPALAPVLPAWDGKLSFWVWLDEPEAEVVATLETEKGKQVPLRPCRAAVLARQGRWRVKWALPRKLALGYYTLRVEVKGRLLGTSFVIAAPMRIPPRAKDWGLFAPYYALRRTPDDLGGDYTALAAAARFVGREGGGFLGTLPLGPLFYEGKYRDLSPYAPISRLFYNEMLLDVSRLPEAPAWRPEEKEEAKVLARQQPRDEAGIYAFRRRMLKRAAAQFFKSGKNRGPSFKKFLAETPYLKDYARHRAAGNKAEYAYHLYAQYACAQQLRVFHGKRRGVADLYVDYPVGVHHAGFDATYFSKLFIKGFSVGAPPDRFAAAGQNWGFPPLHPRRLVEDKFSYLRAALSHSLKTAPMLRLDHMMGFFRIFCVARGAPTSAGAYVLYPHSAIMAVLCLEAHRHKAVLIGEDLGIVPQRVRDNMTRHGIGRIWVGQFEMTGKVSDSFRSIIPAMIAGANTHDLFPFAAHMAGSDIRLLTSLHLLTPARAAMLTAERNKNLRFWRREKQPLQTFLKNLAASKAEHVIINTEDLWGETLPQNIPGISSYRNWEKPYRYAISQWAAQPEIVKIINTLNHYRGANIPFIETRV